MNLVRRLFEHYRNYHAYGPPRLKYMGILGMLSFVAFYFIRFTRPNPQPMEDLELRIVVVLMMSALALKDVWPRAWARWYIHFSYLAMLFSLPFFAVYTGLERGGGMPAISNAFISLCFLTLLVDWRNTIVMLLVSIAAGLGLFRLTSPGEPIPSDLLAQWPAFLVIAIGANLFKFSTEQIETERQLRAAVSETERKLRASVSALRETLGFLAHELNTPLATVRGCVHSVLTRHQPAAADAPAGLVQFEEERPGDLLAALERAERRALYCQSLVSTFVQSARDAYPGAPPQTVSASSLITALLTEFPFEGPERSWVSTAIAADFRLPGRRDLFYLVLCTVAKNALQVLRGRESPQLRIEAGCEPGAQGPRGWIRVIDNGPGIEPDVLARLTREPVTTRANSGGNGMGLLFCHRIMQSAGGSVRVESAPGQGTTVLLSFDRSVEPVGAGEGA
jgi:signal transduction histidine kinase